MSAAKAAKTGGCDFGRDTRGLLFKLLTVVCALLLAAVSVAGMAHNAAADAREAVSAMEVGAGQREDRWKQLDPRLTRIEDKLDKLLERGPGG